MQILLANAKIMRSHTARLPWTSPRFASEAERIALQMAACDIGTLEGMLGCSRKLAAENWQRFQDFPTARLMPALFAYNGQAYKYLRADSLGDEALEWGQGHLWITSFLYGMLRPMDGVAPYRMECHVVVPGDPETEISHYWRELLTDALIESVKQDDGYLVHLSTKEYESLFDWRRVTNEVQVIQPIFSVRTPDGQLKVQAVWAKACRGAMVRYIMEHALAHPDDLAGFSEEGFVLSPLSGSKLHPHFIRE